MHVHGSRGMDRIVIDHEDQRAFSFPSFREVRCRFRASRELPEEGDEDLCGEGTDVFRLHSMRLGAFFAALNVKYRDIRYVIPFLLQLLMFASPIIYPASLVPERFQWLLALNPLSGLIEAFRYVVIPSHGLDWNLLIYSFVITGLLFVTSVAYFKSAEKAFADIV